MLYAKKQFFLLLTGKQANLGRRRDGQLFSARLKSGKMGEDGESFQLFLNGKKVMSRRSVLVPHNKSALRYVLPVSKRAMHLRRGK